MNIITLLLNKNKVIILYGEAHIRGMSKILRKNGYKYIKCKYLYPFSK